jgi:outer membrane receptor protein involved in Fe transport
MSRQHRGAPILLALALALPTFSSAQAPDTTRKVRVDSSRVRQLDPINVTATRSAREIFRTPQPVLVVDSAAVRRRAAYTVSDLFRLEPGVDITGTGSNQARLAIRGQRGQRILLLENGIRLNNARRQQDFGELPALSDVESLERVELVRGPASVLYGTDAIGGVVNLFPAGAPTSGPSRIGGEVGYRYSSHDRQSRPAGYVAGRLGGVGFRFSGTWRDTEPYRAPSGSFGSLTLSQPVRVHDTGVRDENYSGEIGIAVAEGHNLFARYARYQARDFGFGFVNPDDFGAPDDPDIRISYPEQTFQQASVRYQTSRISSFLADRLELTTYYQSNARDLNLDVFVPFGSPPAAPGGGVSVASRNFTDIDTWGFRVEAARIVGGRHTITYGGDFSRDDSFNRDSSLTRVTGFGPPQQEISNTPPVPNAIYQTGGLFAQASLALTSRLSTTLGARVQDVRAHTLPTEGVTGAEIRSDDQTVVGAANLLYQLTPQVALVGNAGRAFRSPNLVERFFEGPTPEGSGFQQRNPELEPETSFTVDLGLKVRAGPAYLEGFYFRSTIRNGIRIEPTGEMVGPFPAFRNVNVDKIRDEGVELLGDVRLASGLGARASFSTHSAEDALNPNNPVGDTYARKLAGELRYDDPAGRFWLSYGVRHQGERKDVALGAGPVGDVLPAFTVHGAGAGLSFLRTGRVHHDLAVNVSNLGNRLYAEFPNASFFRPEPGRSVTVTYRLGF